MHQSPFEATLHNAPFHIRFHPLRMHKLPSGPTYSGSTLFPLSSTLQMQLPNTHQDQPFTIHPFTLDCTGALTTHKVHPYTIGSTLQVHQPAIRSNRSVSTLTHVATIRLQPSRSILIRFYPTGAPSTYQVQAFVHDPPLHNKCWPLNCFTPPTSPHQSHQESISPAYLCNTQKCHHKVNGTEFAVLLHQ